METIEFTYVVNGQARSLPVIVSEGRIVVRNIADLLGVYTPRAFKRLPVDYGAVPVKGYRTNAALALLPADMDRWLTAHVRADNELHVHVATNLMASIREKSLDLRVVDAVKAAEQAKRNAEVTIIGHALESPDVFRQQATRGGVQNWLPPALIDGAVRRRRIDTFRVVENLWTEQKEIVHVEMTIAPGASLTEFSRLHASGELMTGPEMQAKFPLSPLLKRHTIAEHYFAAADDDSDVAHGKVVLIPAQPSRFAWEKDMASVPQPKGAKRC
jgi:hypothetical protein